MLFPCEAERLRTQILRWKRRKGLNRVLLYGKDTKFIC